VGIGREHETVDPALVRRAQRGDAWALDALIRALEPYLGRICGAIALEAGDDALQEAMIAVIRNLGSLREPLALRGWARRIAVREAVRVAHRHDRTAPVDPVDPAGTLAQLPTVDDGLTDVEVRAVLAGLRPEQRAVLVLRHVDGIGEQEMADLLGVAPGTVKSRLSRARAAFREQWSS